LYGCAAWSMGTFKTSSSLSCDKKRTLIWFFFSIEFQRSLLCK
jgi:hypothetical protein